MRYDRTNLGSTLNAAIELAKKDGNLRYVSATALGYTISKRRTSFQDCYWTNGQEWGTWKSGEKEGQVIHRIKTKEVPLETLLPSKELMARTGASVVREK